jgi:hypothetical protein
VTTTIAERLTLLAEVVMLGDYAGFGEEVNDPYGPSEMPIAFARSTSPRSSNWSPIASKTQRRYNSASPMAMTAGTCLDPYEIAAQIDVGGSASIRKSFFGDFRSRK